MARGDLTDQEWTMIVSLLPLEGKCWARPARDNRLFLNDMLNILRPVCPNPQSHADDRGYDSDSFQQDLLIYGILPVIPSRQDRFVIHEFSQSRRHKALDQVFCQRDLTKLLINAHSSSLSSGRYTITYSVTACAFRSHA